MSEFRDINKRDSLVDKQIDKNNLKEEREAVVIDKGISDESLEGLRAEFVSLGGLVDRLPEVSSVRDWTMIGIPHVDSGGEKIIDLWLMMNGEWYSLNSYRLTPTGASGSVSQYETVSEIIISTTGLEVEIVSANIVGGADDWTELHNDNIKYSDGAFTIIRAGKYFVSWSISFHAGSANQDIKGGLMLNGINTGLGGWAQRRIGTASDVGSMSANGIARLSKGNIITMAVLNDTSTANIFIDHASFSIGRIR